MFQIRKCCRHLVFALIKKVKIFTIFLTKYYIIYLKYLLSLLNKILYISSPKCRLDKISYRKVLLKQK